MTQLTTQEIIELVNIVSKEDKIIYLMRTGMFIEDSLSKKSEGQINGLYKEVITIEGI